MVTLNTDVVGTVDEAGVLWKATKPGSFVGPWLGCKNLYETLVKSATANPSAPSAGVRDVVSTTMEGKFEKLTLSPDFNFWSYKEYLQNVDSFGAGLKVAVPALKPKDTIVIYADTSRPWMLAAYGAWRQGLVVGTIYATLGEEGALFGLNQAKCKMVVADGKLLKVLSGIASQLTTVKDVVAITEPPAEAAAKLKAAGISIHLMDEVIAAGAKAPSEPTPLAPSETAVLMYTSGTTGNPKGVLISHNSLLCVMSGSKSDTTAMSLNGRPYLRPDSVYLAYLPLAHIMELSVEVTCFAVGCKVGYGSPGTITPTAPKMLQTDPPQKGDAMALAPTIFVAAPAVLDRVLIAIKAKFGAASAFIQRRIDAALASGFYNYDHGGVGAHWSYLIGPMAFKKAQALLGGKVEIMLTGSAPLGVEVQKWVQTVFCCRVRQGYGLTETCAATCIALASDNTTSCVGPPQESACIRLRDWEEGGYRNSDKDGEIGMRRGEILIGGPGVCDGYLVDSKNPDKDVVKKNKEEFVTIDGARYFCTGDVGQITPKGNLQIIDRVKDLVKLQMGEYVALSKVENALKASKYVALPMVYATSTMSYCIALVCPNVPVLKKLAEELGVGGELKDWCKDAKVIAAVLKDLAAACGASKLAKFETPSKVVLIEELWTPENDMLTAVQKLKRREIVAKHKADIDAVYI